MLVQGIDLGNLKSAWFIQESGLDGLEVELQLIIALNRENLVSLDNAELIWDHNVFIYSFVLTLLVEHQN